MKVGVDFDGTLACLRPGAQRQFHDARQSILDAAALLGPTLWVQRMHTQGHEVLLISGRSVEHQGALRRWCLHFLGFAPPCYLRPRKLDLSCNVQATWKSQILRENGVSVYVGDNPRIDLEAARLAGIDYIDVGALIRGSFPLLGTGP